MNIRPAIMKDLQFIISADEETRIIEERDDLKLNDADIRSIREEIKNKELLILEEKNEIIGFISFKSDFEVLGLPGKVFWVDLVFVSKDHRGKGIGKQLYAEAIKIAKLKGYKKIYCEIYAGNSTSQSIHKRLGFTPALTIHKKNI